MSGTGDVVNERGATLIEMLVVVGVMGLIAGLVFPEFTHAKRSASFQQAAERLDADLRLARADAAREGHASVVELDSDGRGYAGPRGAVTLPDTLRLEGESRAISFFADGSSTGGRWRLVDGGRRAEVGVDEVTGVATSVPR